jgi:UDP-N-acetylmuramyl pentapeptide phosphotransferase/UDP-N-acetylglucosamine-1-phosphate transferase
VTLLGRLGLAGACAVGAFAFSLVTRRVCTGKRWQRTNFRGRSVSLALGVAATLATLAGAAAAAAAGGGVQRRAAYAALLVVAVAGAIGLVDDLVGATGPKGFAGHLRALARGRVTTGLLKLAVIGLAALGAAAVLRGGARVGALLDAALIAGTANFVNLLDLRPGRALKLVLVASAPLVAISSPGAALAAVPAGTAAGLLPADLREHGMLGDAGANAFGAAYGVVVVAALGTAATAVALGVVASLTLVSEVVSFSRVIDRSPPLRWFDALGRDA